MDILRALDDPALFRTAIKDPATWVAWRSFLACLFGLPLSNDLQAIASACTGVSARQSRTYNEAWLVCGRRAGKSFVLALVAVYLACFKSYAEHLAIGERATIMIIAADRRQARTILRYVAGLLKLPIFKALVERETAEGFDLNTRITVEVVTCSIRSVRGYSIAAALCDELAFWSSEDSAAPDTEVLDSIRPGMAMIPGAMLLCASSPYAKRGAMWSAYRRHFGKADAPVLVWQAETRAMNPIVPQSFIDAAFEADPVSAASEYGATFRNDVAGWADRTLIDAAVDNGVTVRPPRQGTAYRSGCDPSGGARDSFTLAIAHDEDGVAVLDCVVEVKAPFNPTSATEQMAATLKTYGLRATVGDRYAAEWVVDAFAKCGIKYQHSERDRSAIYLDALPMFTSGRVRLLDNPRLTTQFASLERKTSSSGKDRVDHGPNGHDDLCNSVAIALVAKSRQPMVVSSVFVERMRGSNSWAMSNPNY